MDTRDTPEQAELRRSARQLARELGPSTVADLDDAARHQRLAAAVRDAGWLELRGAGAGSAPLASGVEAAIVADSLGGAAADVAFAGPVLAADLARRAGLRETAGAVAFSPALVDVAIVRDGAASSPLFAVDCEGEIDAAYVLIPAGSDFRVATVPLDGAAGASAGSDLTRRSPCDPGRLGAASDRRRGQAPHECGSGGVDRARFGAHERRPRRRDAGRARRHGRVRGGAPAVRRAGRFVPGGAAPARRGALPDGGLAQRRAARVVGGRQPCARRRAARQAASPRRTARVPRARCARPRFRCTAASATRGSAWRTSTCGARCSRRSGSATTTSSCGHSVASVSARELSGVSDGLS